MSENPSESLGEVPGENSGTSEPDIQQLIDTILTPIERSASGAAQTRDGQIAENMRQQALLLLTRHAETEKRQQAAELLGESRQDAAREALISLASDPDSQVRQQALTSLEGFPDASVTQAMLAALDDEDYLVRATAAELLGARKANEAVEPLMSCLHDADVMVRATAAEALGRMEAFMAAPALRDALLDQDQWVRYGAAESLCQIEPDEEIWPLLMNANSAELQTRLEALRDLGKLGDRRAIPALVKMLRDDSELEEPILNALETIYDPLTIPALVELALFTEKPHLREQALIQAQQHGIEATLEALASWLDPDRPQYAHNAIEALHQLPTAETTPIFVYALQHPDRWVCTVAMITLQDRRQAVDPELLLPLLDEPASDLVRPALRNLLQHHPGEAEPVLERFAAAEAEWQRLAVAENLGSLPQARAQALAARLLDDPGEAVREACLRSLSAHGAAALDQLLAGSHDGDAWVRQAAIESLGRLDQPSARARLLEILAEDEDFLVRGAAAEALAEQGGEEVRAGLSAALGDSKPSVRLQAAHALFSQAEALPPELLERLLGDDDKSVVLAALQHLRGKQADQALASRLSELKGSDDAQIRAAATAL